MLGRNRMWSKDGLNSYGDGLGNYYFSQKESAVFIQKSLSDGTGEIALFSESNAKLQEKSPPTESFRSTDNLITSSRLTVCESCFGIWLGNSMVSPSAFRLWTIRSTLRLRIGLQYFASNAMAAFIPLAFGMLTCRGLELEVADLEKRHLFEPSLALHSTPSEFLTSRTSHHR